MEQDKPKPLRGKALRLAKQQLEENRHNKLMEILERSKANKKTLPNGLKIPPLPLEHPSVALPTLKPTIKDFAIKLNERRQKEKEEALRNIDGITDELIEQGSKLSPHQLNLLLARELSNKKSLANIEDEDEDDDTPFVEVNFENPEETKFPSYVGKVARKVFIDVMKMYSSNGIENLLDNSTVLLYATTVEKFHQYEKRFASGVYEYTMYSPTTGLRMETPESKIHNQTISSMKTLGSLLLMNPKSRGSSVAQKKQKSALEEFLTSRKKGK